MAEQIARTEEQLLAAIAKAITDNKPLEAEQWTHTYLQFQHALQMKRAS